MCPAAKHFILCLVLVKPRKTHPDMTEKSVDLGLKNQIKQNKTVCTCQRVPYAGNWINFLCKI